MTKKQKLFVSEFPIDLNATQAAIRAGYSPKTANRIASENLSKPVIQEAIADAMEERMARLKVDADYVLEQAVKIHERCMQEIRPLTDRKGNGVEDDDGHPLYIFNVNGAIKSLELIGRHVNVQAWKEKLNQDESLPIVIVHDPSSETSEEKLRDTDVTPRI